jgi:hypothetical protein
MNQNKGKKKSRKPSLGRVELKQGSKTIKIPRNMYTQVLAYEINLPIKPRLYTWQK